jgi:hypothetical protein
VPNFLPPRRCITGLFSVHGRRARRDRTAASAKGEARRGSRSRRRLRRACQESTLLIEPPKLFLGDPDAHDILRGICPGRPNAVLAPKLRAGSPKIKTILLILDIPGGRRISAFNRWRYYNMHAGEIEWRMCSHQTDIQVAPIFFHCNQWRFRGGCCERTHQWVHAQSRSSGCLRHDPAHDVTQMCGSGEIIGEIFFMVTLSCEVI